jgi:predicted XRE-type DNA-binding protein
MDNKKQKALEAAGWRIGDAGDFLDLTDEESQLVELRLTIGRSIRRLRETQNLTQQQLAAKIKSSQSRVAKIEAATADVSLDLMFRGFFAAGGQLADLIEPVLPTRQGARDAQAARPRESLGKR